MIYISAPNEPVEHEWITFQDIYHNHYDFIGFDKALRYYGRPFRFLRLPLSFFNHNRDYHLFCTGGREYIHPKHFRATLEGFLLDGLKPTKDFSIQNPLEASGKQLPGPSSQAYLGGFVPRHRV